MGEEPVEKQPKIDPNIEKYLDELDLDRLEIDRILDDLFPEEDSSQPPVRAAHKDTDPVQRWLAEERQR